MPYSWVVNPDYPNGHLVPLTTEQQAQYDVDQAAGLATGAAQETSRANLATLTAALTTRMTSLRQARTALAGGAIFAGMSANEKKVIDLLLQDDLQIARIVLERFDDTDA